MWRRITAAVTVAPAVVLVSVLAGSDGPARTPSPRVTTAWSWEMPRCVGYRPADYRAPAHRRAVEVRERPRATELVETYRPGWGARAVAEIRAVLRACARYEYGGARDPEAFLQQNRVVRTGFAGEDSLLVETVHLTPPTMRTWYTAVVRHGDVVVTLRTSELGAAQASHRAAATAAASAQGRA